MRLRRCLLILFAAFSLTYCQSGSGPAQRDGQDESVNSSNTTGATGAARNDGAKSLSIPGSGSLQNPAFSPDGTEILFTYFKNGYNKEPADLKIFNRDTQNLRTLVSDGSGNVNLPGSTWNAATGTITFSSSREPHDEVYVISAAGAPGSEKKVTARDERVCYEPSFSPDGQWIVCESHKVDMEDNGVITKYKLDGSSKYIPLTEETEDCRQPNWAPSGDRILYQCRKSGQWDLWVSNTEGADKKQITEGAGDKTDASFSPDGQRIVYSSSEGGLSSANLFVIPVSGGASRRLTNFSGYDGAPSWHGDTIAFESFPGDPDGSAGTTLWTISAPK